MSETFQAGDVVKCISTTPNPSYQPDAQKLTRLRKGAIYRVERYLPPPGRAGVQLVGLDHTPGDGWQAWRFRKVLTCDASFHRSLNAPDSCSEVPTAREVVRA